MFKVKQLGVAAALLLTAASVMASNFRAGDQVYLPIAGHFTGAKNETFQTDISISNLSDDAVDVSIILGSGSAGTQKTFPKAITLAARERRELKDFYNTLQPGQPGSGLLVFNACKKDQDCTPDQLTGLNPNFRNISIESRVYSIPQGADPVNGPTTGQGFPGIPWYNFISSTASGASLDRAFITGLRNTGIAGTAGTYRTNIGLVNASQFSTTNIEVRLFDGTTGNAVGTTFTQTLSPLGQVQKSLGEMFGTVVPATNAYITVNQANVVKTGDADANGCTNGCPAFLAYGSLLDNVTDDATTLESQYTQPLSDKAINCIYSPDSATQCKTGFPLHRAAKHQF